MKKYLGFIFILVAAVLEATLLWPLGIFNVRPNLIFIALILVTSKSNLRQAIILAVFAGALKDIFSANSFGIYTLLFPALVYSMKIIFKKISSDSALVYTSIFSLLVMLSILAQMFIFNPLLKYNAIPLGIFSRILFIETIYTTAVFFLGLKRLKL